MASTSLMDTYKRADTAFEMGQGAWLFDTNGNKYLDLLSGIAVCGLGHSHPAVTHAIRDQAGRLLHTSNLYEIPLQTELANRLTKVSGMDKVFFCNSGAEANEAAIKLARLYGHKQGINTPNIIVVDSAFHGRTMATLTATGNRKAQAGFEPLVNGFIRAPYDDIDAIKTIAGNTPDVVAIFVEPIQGEGGVHVPAENYLNELRTLCDENNWLLMLDEVQTGNGRTGKYFAYQHNNILPDVVTTAKGLGNGVPIGACLAQGKAASVLQAGTHGSTFGGNPLVCAAALATVDTLIHDKLIERAESLGQRMLDGLKARLADADYITDIRGKGLMIGIELNEPCTELVMLAKAKGLLINVTANSVIRLLPPLILTDEEADLAVEAICKLIKVYAGDDRQGQRRAKDRDTSDRRQSSNKG
ncbi:Acetylornithine aminotransferase [gamma proteobacterium IMCC2047]|nr:Acetylornithine aminotransferase [gamma proteobacterium IMCC2047]